MASLVLTSFHGRLHHAIEYAEPSRPRERLGTELQRVQLTDRDAGLPIDILVALLRMKGALK